MLPRLHLPVPAGKGQGGIPRVLTLLTERIGRYYYDPRRVLPSLDLANGSLRQMRTERREACLLLLAAILKFTDLASLRVGIPTKNGFMCLTVDYLADQSGIGQRRVERALRDLKRANLLTIRQPRQLEPDGRWRGLAAVKAVSKELFAVFGLKVALKLEQAKAVKRLRKMAEKWEEEDGQPRTLGDIAKVRLVTGLREQTSGRHRGRARPPDDTEYRRAYNLKCAELMEQHPDWQGDRVRAEAEHQVKALVASLRV